MPKSHDNVTRHTLEGIGVWEHPVVHIAFQDAAVYADWVGKTLPPKPNGNMRPKVGGLVDKDYAWGDKFAPDGQIELSTPSGLPISVERMYSRRAVCCHFITTAPRSVLSASIGFTSRTPDLIIKSGREEYPGLAINEFLCMSVAKEAGMPVPEFYLSENAKLFVMWRFDRDEHLNPLGFEDTAVLMGLPTEQKYSKSYSAIAKAIRMYCARDQIRESLAQLFATAALSCIVGNGDAHLKNFGLLYSEPVQRDARLAPVYDIVNTTAYIPQDVLALDLVGNKSLFASRQGLLDFAVSCGVEHPAEVIRGLLEALERVLQRYPSLCEQAPGVTAAIRQSAAPFIQTFG